MLSYHSDRLSETALQGALSKKCKITSRRIMTHFWNFGTPISRERLNLACIWITRGA